MRIDLIKAAHLKLEYKYKSPKDLAKIQVPIQ